MKITTRKVLAYAILPQMLPRLRDLFSGFGFVAFFLAQIYRSAGLLPSGHPYLLASNNGRYGISHVIAEAGLLLKKKNASMDQYAIYWLLMVGLVILAAQVAILAGSILIQPAHAGPFGPATNFFITTAPAQDLAFVLLDRVFGVPNLFNSCVTTGDVCLGSVQRSGSHYTGSDTSNPLPEAAGGGFPYPYHLALHSAFELYSVALLVIAAIILAYFMFAVIAETAETGTPFGRRFNKVWAPLRLVVALGLLVPIANGLNAAQYITLYAAKFGSGFATNGWNYFATQALTGGGTMLGQRESMIAIAKAPPPNTLVQFFSLVATCKKAYETVSLGRGDPVRIEIHPYLINPKEQPGRPRVDLDATGFVFADAVDYYHHSNIIIRFGAYAIQGAGPRTAAVPVYSDDTANVAPLCGELILPVTNADPVDNPGAWYMLQQYYQTVLSSLWFEASGGPAPVGGDAISQTANAIVARDIAGVPAAAVPALPTTAEMVARRDEYVNRINFYMRIATTQQATSPILLDSLTEYGWAGAGIWYNRIAQVNGSLISAVYNMPSISRMPQVMEEIAKARQSSDQDVTGTKRYQPYLSNGEKIEFRNTYDQQVGVALFHAYDHWSDNFAEMSVSGNIFMDTINAIFGTAGLFNMRANQDAGIHPLAQLVGMGRSILESAIRNLGAAAIAGIGGGVINLLEPHLVGTVALAVSSFLFTVAMTGLGIGFVLYYIIPFLPFVYFFFAVGGWIKGIFEAMVGMPLWALAHLRIDGNGLPGDAAMGGYWLILEIFLRPILIIFGMVGGIAIFTAQATVLNETWSLVTSNLTGFDVATAPAADVTGAMTYLRGAVDKLFFTVMYAIIIYMLAMASFKMVDLVPNFILRWMGAGVQSFGEQSGDPAEHLVRNTFGGASQITGQLRGAVTQGAGGIAQGLKTPFGAAKGFFNK